MPLRYPLPTGFVARGFEAVSEAFSESFTKGIEKGASFAAYYRGQPVVNLWGGLADEQAKRPWKEDTMGFLHSITKQFAGLTTAHMVDRGLLRYDGKIANYWPEFAQNGKENITLAMLLTHRSGLAALSENYEASWIRDDPRRLHDQLAKQKPWWIPGEAHGYHRFTIGLYLDEIVRRVDKKGRNLSQYFQEEIAVPFGIDLHIGVPKHLQYRAARLDPIRVTKEFMADRMTNFQGDLELYKMTHSEPMDWTVARRLNDPDFMELPCPSSHGAGTALAVAKFSGILANGGKHEGKTLLSPETIAKLQVPTSQGLDLADSDDTIYGLSTCLFPVVEGDETWFMFGHVGYGDQCTASDPRYKVGWAYLTNYLDQTRLLINQNNNWRPLIKVLFECVHKLEGVKFDRKILCSFEDLEKEKRLLCRLRE